jgi:large subunit ribosomal protein L9
MEVVLLKDVERLGAEGATVQVAPGFARNYLIPRGLAAPATAQQLKVVEERQRQRARELQRVKAQAAALKQKLERRSLTLKLALGAEDKPFGSVTTHDILEALAREGIDVEKHAIQLKEPIKALGVYEIPIRLPADLTATLKLWVVKG